MADGSYGRTYFTKVGYDERMTEVDRRLAEALAAREKAAEGKLQQPPRELREGWAEEFGVDDELLQWMYAGLLRRRQPANDPRDPGALESVVPLMKRAALGDFQYTITHAMQHEHASMVDVDIRATRPVSAAHLRIELTLEITGEGMTYDVRPNGSQGGGDRMEMTFRVSPRLPDDPIGLRFELVPHVHIPREQFKEIVLDQPVTFPVE
ncbi:hypothetical protein MO973_03050 [Paenibacillus sp. TRM 82003]|nr:hypothetical protein [Paenibacillus sp. TRM 82003]